MLTRNEKLLHCIDLASQIGVEIGPLDKPIVTREMGRVRYVDHDITEALRLKYADFDNVDTDKIVDVDYIWGEKSLVDLTQAEAPFDYIVASHVIEHVPDFIGWLREVRGILKPGGILSLAIPDKRQCFDYHRHPSKPADVVEAYLRRHKKPSPRQIFDHFASAVSFQGDIAWNGVVNTSEFVRFHSAVEAWDIAKTAFAKDNYCDVHCWVFTPASFFSLLSELTTMDLLKFEVAQFYETEGCEFLVSLRAIDEPKQTDLADLSASLSVEAETMLSELQFCKNRIEAMESSKFWKMRKAWFKVKQQLGSSSREA